MSPRFVTVILAAAASVGNGGIGDVVATVRGHLEVTKAAEAEGDPTCVLELFKDGRDDAIRSNKVQGLFVQNYGLAPGRYSFGITCEGGTGPYRSRVYHIQDMRYMKSPIDLGVVTIRTTGAGATSEKRAQSVLSEDKAIEIAVAAVREAKRFSGAECDIKIRKHGDGWAVLFVFLPAGPGLDVLVKVHSDGSHEILPMY